MKASSRSRVAVPGVILVALAAFLWGSDGVLRLFLADVGSLDASVIVMLEHVILTVVTIPIALKAAPALKRLDGKDWLTLLLIGGGASVLATILFTAAFATGDFVAPALLQKLQPIFAVSLAALVLGERLMPRYWFFFIGAMAGAFLIAFPDPSVISVTEARAALLAIGAAALWGMGTVLGRRLTPKIPFAQLTALRFAIGLPVALIVVAARGKFGDASGLESSQWLAILVLALIPGLAGILIYYRGLGRTSASAATLGELAFPLTALAYGIFFLDESLPGGRIVGVILLVIMITLMGLAQARSNDGGTGVLLGEDEGTPALV